MTIPSIKNFDAKGKRVILRVDFNVLSGDGKLEDARRINKAMPTIEYLHKKGAKLIIISHLSAGKNGTLSSIADYINKKYSFPIRFIKEKNIDEIKKETANLKDGEVVLLENIRIHKGEDENDSDFAKSLAGFGDIFVNDAFSASHRNHASIIGLPKILPSFAGFLFEDEMKGLQSAFAPEHPFLFILGGVKMATKLGVLDKFLNIADKVFIGGALANGFLKARGFDIGDSVADIKTPVEKYLKNQKIIFPEDVRRKDGKIYDIGENTIIKILPIIHSAKFILWNGPMGNIEEDGFDKGTKIIAEAVSNSSAKTIIGGGDTVAVIDNMGILDKFSFVSTAGGAMLEFLANGTLPGIEAILKQ